MSAPYHDVRIKLHKTILII
ncbi:unnamed protein product [Leptidea sinapis]|uniref:Uncharacterized protein n=1 Tax=Leptidea sinapis TaxID=189913 RepID=A0A5E4PU08_9NEOP|nr:unnamed protein product [Leptidea sinapis]